ncbi:MAG: Npt1/Npt2 family nucleotide transporter [Gammaproteobacteria bacterium]
MKSVGITRSLIWRASILFINFFLIILAYYHIKPASRSLFIEYLGADFLPYVWIGTAVTLGLLISYYHRLLEKCSRLNLVLGTLATFIAILLVFYTLFGQQSKITAAAFYIFVDIFSVVLVEQFWSLANSIYRVSDGKRWYGIVGTGGLLGGVFGGKMAKMWIDKGGYETSDLLLFAVAILAVLVLLNLVFGRIGVYDENTEKVKTTTFTEGWETLIKNRYLVLIATILMLSQIASPLVEYKFMSMVETHFTDLNQRTSFLSGFFANLGLIAIGINLFITPFVHKNFGTIAGLTLQPAFLLISTWGFYTYPSMLTAQIMKISDRGLAYSINRASRELLYVPLDPLQIYRAKAWIDMFGYRLFKVAGSVLILLLTQWLPTGISIINLSWVTMFVCALWIGSITLLAREHRLVIKALPV